MPPPPGLLGDTGAMGGMVTISLNGGAESVAPFVESLKVITLATSLGDTSSLAWPILGTDLVRLSIGLEDEADLLADLDNALERIPGSDAPRRHWCSSRSRVVSRHSLRRGDPSLVRTTPIG